jgi:hypothetical protein
MEVIGFVVGVVGLMLALFAEVKRREAERRARIREAGENEQADAMMRELQQVLAAVGVPASVEPPEGGLAVSEDRPFAVGIADINNDGRDEVVVASPYGPHSSMLRAFGFTDELRNDFSQLLELGSGTPSGFTVGDLDGDGRVEVATVQPEGDHPYASGIRAEVLYRWSTDHFDEVGHCLLACGDESDGEMRWHTGWAVLSVR